MKVAPEAHRNAMQLPIQQQKSLASRASSSRRCTLCSCVHQIRGEAMQTTSAVLNAGTLQQLGVEGAQLCDSIPADAIPIKTMVLVCDGAGHPPLTPRLQPRLAAVAVLVRAGHKVDLRAVAHYMQLPRGTLRLATAEEAEAATGYALGCIPPLGHTQPLRTLVDVAIAQQTPQQLLCGGGGQVGKQLLLTVDQLLTATAGEVGLFSTQTQQQHQQTQQQQAQAQLQRQQTQRQQQTQAMDAAAFQHLPEPWSAGAEQVTLVGVLAQRRRIAKLLLFATLVPETVPTLPSDGTAAYVRRLWRHPDTALPCEIQLIMGKTIERQLGRDGAAALFDKLKVGAVVALQGKVQNHLHPAGSGGSSPHQQVLDVVVQEIRVLHKNRDSLARAILAAQRRGHTSVASAFQLEQQLLSDQAEAAADKPAAASGRDLASAGRQELPAAGAAAAAGAAGAAVAAGSAAPASSRPLAADSSLPDASQAKSAAASEQSGLQQQGSSHPADAQQQQEQYYAFPLPPQQITVVADLQGVVRMHQKVLSSVLDQAQHTQGGQSSSALSNNSSSSTSRQSPPVVGLDCEWQPYERGEPVTPVSLLQLATRHDVFIVDMLAICRQLPVPLQPSAVSNIPSAHEAQPDAVTQRGHSYSSSSSSLAGDGVSSTAQSCNEAPLLPAEQALGEFLQQLFSSDGIKIVGFQLLGDLQRLAQSYPWLLGVTAAAAGTAGDPGLADAASTSSTAAADTTSPGAGTGRRQLSSLAGWPADGAQTLWVAADSSNSRVWRGGSRPGPNPAAAAAADRPPGWLVCQAVDLQRLVRLTQPHSRQGSLSALVKRTLGQGPLDKSQQASSWGSRPLSDEQLVYAANDAHVLTVLFDELTATAAASAAP